MNITGTFVRHQMNTDVTALWRQYSWNYCNMKANNSSKSPENWRKKYFTLILLERRVKMIYENG